MIDLWHDFGAWLFFHDVPLSPFAIFGAMCTGALVQRGADRWRNRHGGTR